MAPRERREPKDKMSAPGRLRIVAGKWRSRLLPVVDAPGLRPTSERIRETLFNWLAPGIEDSRCLDLFAGTGALGFEALSRGAAEVFFVEQSTPVAESLRRGVETLEAKGATVSQEDAIAFLQSTATQAFDLVFLDPPFGTDLYDELLMLLDRNGWVTDNGLVYLEHDRGRAPPILPAGWITRKQKTTGNVSYSLIRAGSTGD